MSSNEEKAALYLGHYIRLLARKQATTLLSHYFRMLGRKEQIKKYPEFEIRHCDDCEAIFYWNTLDDNEVTYPYSADMYLRKTVCPYGACWRTFKECGHSQYCCNECPNDQIVTEYCNECMDKIALEKTKKNREMLRTSKLTLDKIDCIPLEIQGEIMSNITYVKMFTKDSIMNYKMDDLEIELEDYEYKECERKLYVYWSKNVLIEEFYFLYPNW